MTDRWPNQLRAFGGCIDAIERGIKRLCVTSPTGSGKSTMMVDMINWAVGKRMPVALYTHRIMLYEQTCRALDKAGIDYGKRASGHEVNSFPDVQMCMTQTELMAVYKREYRKLHHAKLVLIDEYHQFGGPTCQRIMSDHVEAGAHCIGYTATPLDLEGVEELLVAGTMSECLRIGSLVKPETYAPDEPDLHHIRKYQVGMDFSEADNVKAIMRPGVFGRVLNAWKQHNPDGKPTLLFGPDVAGSLFFAQEFVKAGISAAHVDGEQIWMGGQFHPTDDETRTELARGSKSGEVKVVCNRFVLREGIDWPWIECGSFATVFGALTSYIQSGGRLLRAHPGKTKTVILDHGGCLDEQTEILTKRGWLRMDQMSGRDTIGTMNLTSGKFEWKPNEGTIIKTSNAARIVADSPHINLCVTDYHMMVMRSDARKGSWKLDHAYDLAKRNSNWIIPTSLVEELPPAPISDSEIGFIGWFLTDGCMDSARIRIYQSESAAKLHHDHILECLKGCGFRYTVNVRTRPSPLMARPSVEVSYCISSGRKSEGGWDRLTPWLDKKFPDIFNTLDRRQFGVLLYAMNLGDGCKDRNRPQNTMRLAVGNEETANRIQSLAVRRGYRCNISTQESYSPLTRKRGAAMHILRIRDASIATISKRGFYICGSFVDGVSRVWCVQTANGTIVVRRQGKVAVVGNSWHRHGSLAVDRHWKLGMTNQREASERQERLREKKEPEPITCGQCGKVRASGPTCPSCGFTMHKKSRVVVQVDGTLKQVVGDINKPRREKMAPNTQELWDKMYYRAKSQKWNATFRQAQAMFFRENHYWPPKTLRLMPKESGDWFRKVADVPKDALNGYGDINPGQAARLAVIGKET
jgi:superfamily II DNA or RNA helicase